MKKRTVTIRGVPDPVLRSLREASAGHHRSLNGELLSILEQAAAERRPPPVGRALKEAAGSPYVTGRESGPPLPFLDAVDRGPLATVCRRHHIQRLAMFGSWAKGDARPDSDVDVVVEFEPGMTPGLGIETVAEDLQSVLGGRKVDLVTRRGLSPRLRAHVLSTAVPLYGG